MDPLDRVTTNSLFEIEAHDDTRHETAQNQGADLEWKQKGLAQVCTVRLRHLNSGKLLSFMEIGKVKKSLVFSLDDNISCEEVNYRIDKIAQIEKENVHNSTFNKMTNPEILILAQGIRKHQVLEIENTITETNMRVKNQSVVKIMNHKYNVTVSTDIKKLDGDEQIEEEDDNGDAIADTISQQYSE